MACLPSVLRCRMYHLVHGRPSRPQGGGKQRLLDAVIEHFTAEGLADQSLRRIAEAVGSSHRMLLYHFGSKDGLLLEVVREVEARTQAAVRRRRAGEHGDADRRGGPSDVGLRRRPRLADFERLFFALYGRALQGDPAAAPLLRGDIEHWLEANDAWTADRCRCRRRATGGGPGARPPRAGRHPRAPARPVGDGRPGRRRRRARCVRRRYAGRGGARRTPLTGRSSDVRRTDPASGLVRGRGGPGRANRPPGVRRRSGGNRPRSPWRGTS